MIHEYLGTYGDTFWVQRLNNAATASGVVTTINDTAPTNHQWNLSVVEVLPPAGPPDTTPPSVAMTAPADTSSVSGSVTLSATASDAVGVVGVQFLLDGVNFGAEDTSAPFSITWNTVTSGNGSHTVTAVARDAAGNRTTAAAVGVTVMNADTTPPAVSVTVPANNASVSGAAVAVTAAASDNIGVASVQLQIDGVNLGAPVTNAPYTQTWNTTTVVDGTHSVTAIAWDSAGNSTTSAASTVTVANAPPTSTISADALAWGDRSTSSTTIATGAFSTTAGKELLLAFVSAADTSAGNTVTGVAGGGLTWQFVVRTNVQRGMAEIWRAFASMPLTSVAVTATLAQPAPASLTVVSFKGVDQTGVNGAGAIGAVKSANASSGAPTVSMLTTRPGSWVLGVGNDWDGGTARTVPANQTMVHQYLATTGDTFWVQRLTNAVPSSGTTAVINDTAPTNHRYNLSAVEILLNLAADTTPPTVTGTGPNNGAATVDVTTNVTATFSEAMNPATIGASSFQLRDPSNTLVPSTVSYDAATATATLRPDSALASGTLYSATVTGVKDVANNTISAAVNWSFTTDAPAPLPPPATTTPVLVVTSSTNGFTNYYSEMLRAEGLNDFTTSDLSQVNATMLAGVDVVVMGEQVLTTTQVTMFTNWVNGGGKLIAMRPDKKLATLLGLSAQTGTTADAYLRIDTSKAPGSGLVNDTIQFHGTSDQYVAVEAATIATLYSDATHPMAFPAVTVNRVGSSGGQAAAFTYDLARSVVYTRQGNPAWAGQERDGFAPSRSDDLFYGAKAGDMKPDWVDLSKVQIPQADEQQRLLANLIQQMTVKPVPRFWYFPKGKKAVVIMTGDDHANGGTAGRFNQYASQSPAGCNVANWDCIRSTSYVFPGTPLTSSQVTSFINQGFEIALHVTMAPGQGSGACGSNFTQSTLQTQYTDQLAQFKASYPGAATPVTHRLHCLMWSDWLSLPAVELQKGARLDTTYYYWSASWVNDHPGMFTGSGMPMRLAGTDGTSIDVYQAVTQMTDESGQTYPLHINTLLDNALGSPGYFGAFTANMHTDSAPHAASDAIVSSALARSVPIVSAKQMLTWLDGRNGSTMGPVTWTGTASRFTVTPATGATGLQLMVPTHAGNLRLTGVTLNGSSVTYSVQTIKGVEYAFMTAAAGQYQANYAP